MRILLSRIDYKENQVDVYSSSSTSTSSVTALPSTTINGQLDCTLRGNTSKYDPYTKLLMYFEGTDASTTFTDEIGKTVTPSGNAQIDTAQYKYGSASGLFDRVGDYLTITNANSDLNIAYNNFTIGFWVRFSVVDATAQYLIDYRQATGTELSPTIYLNASGKFIYYTNGADRITGTTTAVANTWYHVAVVRSGQVTKLYINGTQEGSSYTDTNNYISVSTIKVGVAYDNTLPFAGWMDELRISNIARYTTTFTPATLMSLYHLNRSRIYVTGKNLVRNGNGEEGVNGWETYNSTTAYAFTDGYFTITDSSGTNSMGLIQRIEIKPNTTYYLNSVVKKVTANARIYVEEYDIKGNTISILLNTNTASTSDTNLGGTFTTSTGADYVIVYLLCGTTGSSTGIADFKQVQLEVGSAATTYESYQFSEAIVPTDLKKISSTIYDTFDVNSGIHTKNISDVISIYGTTYTTWSFGLDGVGFKAVGTALTGGRSAVEGTVLGFKYNNKTLTNNSADSGDNVWINSNVFYVEAYDVDTGWLEAWGGATSFTGMSWSGLAQAYFNGWKLTTANTNVASCVWTGIASGTTQSGAVGYSAAISTIDTGYIPYRAIYQLATPVMTKYDPNVLNAKPSGNIVIETFCKGEGYYNSGVTIDNTSYPINRLLYINKRNVTTGTITEVSTSTATIASNGLSFTLSGGATGDYYEYGYNYYNLGTDGTLAYSYNVNTKAQLNKNTEDIANLDTKIQDLKLFEDARFDGVWRDYFISGLALGSGASAPDLITLGGSGNISVYAFDGNATTEQLYGCLELDHDYKEGSDFTFHVHWCPTTTDVGNVKWGLDYRVMPLGGTLTAEVNTSLTVTAAGGTAWAGKFSGVTISGTGRTIGDQIAFRLYRNPTDGSDTYGADAAILTLGLHVQCDSHGSKSQTAK